MRACFALQQNRKFLDKQYKTVDNSSMLLYTVYNKGGMNLNIIISNSSMQPIY